jgi:hypothetical protein
VNDLDLLGLWEHGADRAAPECALALLAAAGPPADWGQLASLSASERDARLLDLRARLFGDHLAARAACPACAQDIDLELRVSALRDLGIREPTRAQERVTIADTTVLVRAPSANDLVLAARCDTLEAASRLLFERCIVFPEGSTPDPSWLDTMPAPVLDALDRVAGAAALQLHITCADCGAASDLEFDIVSFLWRELTAEARRLATEVVELARGLGWSEQEILTLSPMRRRLYLDLVRS